ncbi:MAG: hypothetical protein ACRD3M_13060, partial [Thermoanaerobaculia bacterium]
MVRLREALILVGGAILCAVVSNLVASPTRRLPWIGRYPAALTVPAPSTPAVSPEAAAAPAAPATGLAPAREYAPHPD